MTRKFSEARRQAFLDGVRETGNQSIAAERAKVSRSWVQLHRSGDADFDAAVRGAVAAFRASVGTGPHPSSPALGKREKSNSPPRGWSHFKGAELVVRGTGGAGGGKRVQIARARLAQWTADVEEKFLAALAVTCNVKASCAHVRMTPASAYNHRKRWPAFAERWDQAILDGFEWLDQGAVAGTIATFDKHIAEECVTPQPPPIVEPVSVDQAIRLMRMHERRAREAEARWSCRKRGLGPKWPGMRRG